MVELAEALTGTVEHADWAIFSKNGTDATTQCVTIARAATGKRKILVASGAYHGAAPWCTPGPSGVLAEDRAHLIEYRFNDLASVESAWDEAGDDAAGIVVSPIRHDIGIDLEAPAPSFAAGLRALCDRTGAVLILDDVRCGFRLHHGSSWEPLGVEPDLSAWSKAIANGYALGAVLGKQWLTDAARSIYTTGSFWFAAVSMAASLATLRVLADDDTVGRTVMTGTLLRQGLADQAATRGVDVTLSGPVQMPFLTFADDGDFALANTFARSCILGGVYLHPRHNWFVSGAMDEADVDRVLQVTDAPSTPCSRAPRRSEPSRPPVERALTPGRGHGSEPVAGVTDEQTRRRRLLVAGAQALGDGRVFSPNSPIVRTSCPPREPGPVPGPVTGCASLGEAQEATPSLLETKHPGEKAASAFTGSSSCGNAYVIGGWKGDGVTGDREAEDPVP